MSPIEGICRLDPGEAKVPCTVCGQKVARKLRQGGVCPACVQRNMELRVQAEVQRMANKSSVDQRREESDDDGE